MILATSVRQHSAPCTLSTIDSRAVLSLHYRDPKLLASLLRAFTASSSFEEPELTLRLWQRRITIYWYDTVKLFNGDTP